MPFSCQQAGTGNVGKRVVARAGTVIKFLASGIPSFLVAVPLNWLLVEHAGFPHAAAYAVVLVFQVSVNYLMCKAFVFRMPGRRVNLGEFRQLTAGILVFRLLDWGVYLFLVKILGIHYLLAQIFNVVVFALAKFLYTERVLTGVWGGVAAAKERETQ